MAPREVLVAAGWICLLVIAPCGFVSSRAAGDPTQQATPWGTGDDAELERFLLEAEIVEVKDLGTGVTRPKKMTLRLGERVGHGIWKDVEEEYARPNTATRRFDELYFSDRWQHEIAAYRLDRLVGLGMVPVTVPREWKGRRGSLQLWVEDATSERDRLREGIAIRDPAQWRQAGLRMKFFDLLLYNVDRNQQNVLVTEPGSRMWLVDHSRTFRVRPELPPMGKKSERAKIPADLLGRFLAPSDESIRKAMDGLLTRGQIKALLARRQRLRELVEETPQTGTR